MPRPDTVPNVVAALTPVAIAVVAWADRIAYVCHDFEDAVRECEKRFISRVRSSCDGSLTKASDTLGIHRNTLTRKIATYKLKRRS